MSNLDLSNLQEEVENLRNKGLYKKAYELITTSLKKIDLNKVTRFKLIYFLIEINYEMAKFNEGLKILLEVVENPEFNKNTLLMIDFLILQANIYWRLGEPQKGLRTLNTAEMIIVDNKFDEKKEFSIRKAFFVLTKASLYQIVDKLELCLPLLSEALSIFKKKGHLIGKITTLNRFGRIYWKKAQLSTALDSHNQALELSIQIGNQALIAQSYLSLGIIYDNLGDFNEAFTNYQKSLEIWDKIGHKYYFGATLNNLGEIFLARGNLKESFNYFDEALSIFEEIGNKYIKADIIKNIGLIYQYKGDQEMGNKLLQQGLEMYESLGNYADASIPYFLLIKNLVEQNKNDMAQYFYQKFEAIDKKSENAVVHYRFLFAKAQILELSKRSSNKVKANEIYEKIEQADILDHDVAIEAMIKSCEFLIEELFNTGNNTIIKEIDLKLAKLLNIGTKQNLFPLIIEIKLFKSKLELLKLNINESQELLFDAELLANEIQIKSFVDKITNLKSDLKNYIRLLKSLSTENPSLSDRIRLLKLENFLDIQFSRQIPSELDFNNEVPIMFIIASESGISLYHEFFEEKSRINSNLISGFLTAINEFGKETFSVEESVKKISIQDYNLIIRPWKTFLFSYIYRGSYIMIYEKFQNLIVNITEITNDWLDDLEKDHLPLSEKRKEIVNKEIRKIISIKE